MFDRLRNWVIPPDPSLVANLRQLLAHAPTQPFADDQAFDAWIAQRAEQAGRSPEHIEFLWSAVGSYRLRNTVLKGMNANYDADFEAVFRALTYIGYPAQPHEG